MGVLHFWSPWLTHSNRFLKWHSYFNTIVFIYSCKITLNHSSKKNVARGQNVGAVQLDLPVWGKKIHIFMWNQTSKEQILDVNAVQFTIFIKSSQYCSKCNPNLASKKKKYSKSKTVLQYSNKKKSAGEPKETSASHSHFWQSFLNIFTPRNVSYAQRKHKHPSDPRTSGRRRVEIEGAVRNH